MSLGGIRTYLGNLLFFGEYSYVVPRSHLSVELGIDSVGEDSSNTSESIVGSTWESIIGSTSGCILEREEWSYGGGGWLCIPFWPFLLPPQKVIKIKYRIGSLSSFLISTL